MNLSRVKTFPRIYLIVALLAGVLLSSLPYSGIALGLVAMQLAFIYRPPAVRLNLAACLLTLFLLPLTLEPAAGKVFPAFLIIPALPLLDNSLRENAREQASRQGSNTTPVLEALALALLLVIAASLLLSRFTLTLTGILLTGYLLGVLIYVLVALRGIPLSESRSRTRVIVGNNAEVKVALHSRARTPLHLHLSTPYPWVDLYPSGLSLDGEEKEINLTLTPPLAGPAKLTIAVSLADAWGLTRREMTLEPVELEVIPRARYARWLAERYLGQATLGTVTTPVAFSSYQGLHRSSSGIEFSSLRLYLPGDRMRDIDWKHTYQLRQLIVKERREARGQAAIVLANLSAGSEEEKDWLAYQVVISALTLAREGVPLALAAYNPRETVAATPLLNPREAVQKALQLSQDIVMQETPVRVLQPPDIRRLRRTMTQLEEIKMEPARRLREILWLEHQALQQIAQHHPAMKTLTEVVKQVRPPAILVIVSSGSDDAEALPLAVEKMEKQGYRILQVEPSHHHGST